MGKKSANLAASKKTITDTALLLTITIVTFVINVFGRNLWTWRWIQDFSGIF